VPDPPGTCTPCSIGGEHVLATCPTAEPSWYEGVGHTAYLEQPERFNRELAALTRRVATQATLQAAEPPS